jgi:hypothetical protein
MKIMFGLSGGAAARSTGLRKRQANAATARRKVRPGCKRIPEKSVFIPESLLDRIRALPCPLEAGKFNSSSKYGIYA